MKLCEHADFEQAIIRAAAHFRDQGMRPSIIEKVYYVTAALRTISSRADGKVIFKGGTSLSKGWNIIQRFSEDIDIFLDPQAYKPQIGKRGVDRELKNLRDAVARHPGLTLEAREGRTIGGFGRSDRFSYRQLFGGPGEVANWVLVEAGTASGREPTEEVELQSYVGQFLRATNVSLGTDDEGGFPFCLLHFRRTFVEKMFAIHARVELLKRDRRPIGVYARHYYDLCQLAKRDEVREMLRSTEYAAIKADYDRISRAHFSNSYFFPDNMCFANSDALFPAADLSAIIAAEYEAQCKVLCYGAFPSWLEVNNSFQALRDLL